VTLADLSPDQLAVAREKAKEAGVELEDMRETNLLDTPFPDAAFDAVLCMGPMYHLIDEADRQQAAREVARMARPGAPAFVAFLNRLPLPRGLLGTQMPTMPAGTEDLLDRWFGTGIFISPARQFFTDSYYAHPDEIRPLLEGAGFDSLELIGSESLIGGAEERLPLLSERQPHVEEWVIERLIEVAREPSIVGSSWHLLYIGRKR
jgi:SAM-dependent methyltransferase